jgi:hypothetical protein
MSRCCICALVAVVALTAVGCERPSERAIRDRQFAGRILQGTLAYPPSVLVSVSTASDAAEIVMSTEASPAAVVAWYREALRLNGWEIRSEAKDPEGGIALYAQRGERPLWIRMRPSGNGTTYSLIGAAVEGDTIR